VIKLTRGKGWADMFRVYQVFIDGVYCGDIKPKQTKEFSVDNGKHIIWAKIDWFRSNQFVVEVNNDIVELEVLHDKENVREFMNDVLNSTLEEQLTRAEEEGYLQIRRKTIK